MGLDNLTLVPEIAHDSHGPSRMSAQKESYHHALLVSTECSAT
jgi:hypothetical protein